MCIEYRTITTNTFKLWCLDAESVAVRMSGYAWYGRLSAQIELSKSWREV